MERNVMENFHMSVCMSCGAIGIPETAIILNGASIVIPSEKITISPNIYGSNRVWEVSTTFTISSIDGVSEREAKNIIFQENFNAFWLISKKVALYIAEKQIENALENIEVKRLRHRH